MGLEPRHFPPGRGRPAPLLSLICCHHAFSSSGLPEPPSDGHMPAMQPTVTEQLWSLTGSLLTNW